jgi:general secretion pathway protein K
VNIALRGNIQTRGGQRGLALVMVLWLIVLLSILASGHARNVHTETQLAARQLQLAKGRALVEAGVQHAILELLSRDRTDAWPADGSIGMLAFDNARIRIAIRDATGLVDLNAASPMLLSALLASTSVDPGTQNAVVAAVLDWRDTDDLTHLNGAEDSAYLAAGQAWSARDGEFSSVDELNYVMGMNRQLFDELVPFVTVYSEQSGINLEFAAPFLIGALTGENVEPASAQRTAGGQRAAVGTADGTYHVYVSTSVNDKVNASAEAVVRISQDDERPFNILYWREPMRIPFPAQELPGV